MAVGEKLGTVSWDDEEAAGGGARRSRGGRSTKTVGRPAPRGYEEKVR